MFSSLLKDSLVYGMANAVQKAVPFFIIPLIIDYLGADAFKMYDVSFTYAYLFSWLIILGQDAAAAVLYFDEKKALFDKRLVTSYALLIQLGILGLFLCLFFIFSDTWASLLFAKDISIAKWWVKALFILPGFIAFNYSLNILLWQKRKLQYVLLCSLLTILSIGSVGMSVVLFRGDLNILFYCLIASTSISGIAGLFIIRSHSFTSLFPINKGLVKKLLRLGLPFALTAFFHQLLPAIDRYFLIQYNYSNSLPVYVLAAKLGAIMNFGFSAFVLAFTPYSLAKLNEDNAEIEISGLFRTVSIAAVSLVPVLLLVKEQLILFFADSSYLFSANLLPFFFFGWVFDLFCYFPLLAIYRSQNSFAQLLLFFIGTAIIAVANSLLIPRYGLYGAAIGFCFAKASIFFICLFWLRKHFYLRIHIGSFLLFLFMAAASSYFMYVLPLAVNILIIVTIIALAIFYLTQKKSFIQWNQQTGN